MKRDSYLSRVKWEAIVGYPWPIRTGNQFFVTGTTATGEDGQIVGPDVRMHKPFRRSGTLRGHSRHSAQASTISCERECS